MKPRGTIGMGIVLGIGSISSTAHAAWATQTIAGMTVEVYTPATTSPAGDGRALMITMHGCSQTAGVLASNGNFEAAAEAFGVVMAVPAVPGGGVVAGCWDYYGAVHSRTSGHNGPVLELAQTLRDDASYDIDADQVYVVGFSSGGGQALVLGCLAPDVFAGVGVAAGPSLGTSISQIAQVSTTAPQAATLCRQFAGPQESALATQLGVTFSDSTDFTVAQGYNAVNAEMFASVMSDGIGAMQADTVDQSTLPGMTPQGGGTVYRDGMGPRVAALDSTAGVGHNWPAGHGQAGGLLTFVSGQGLDYPSYLAEFFANNSLRADGFEPGSESGGDDTSAGSVTDGGDTDVGDSDDGGEAGNDGGPEESSSASGSGNASGTGADGGNTPSGSAGGASDPEADPVETSGCQCTARSPGTEGAAWCLGVLLGAGRVRRRITGRSSGGRSRR